MLAYDAPFAIYEFMKTRWREKVEDFNRNDLGYHAKGKPSDVKAESFAQILDQVKGKDEK